MPSRHPSLTGSGGRKAEIQRCFENDMFCRTGIALDAVKQNASGGCAQLISRLGDGGKRRIGGFAKVQVVEANQGYVFRAAETRVADREEGPEGNHVIPGENGRGARNEPQKHLGL